MRSSDKVRIWLAIQRLDFWMETLGMGGRDRRHARREVSANLHAAAADAGAGSAIAALGPLPRLASELLAASPTARARFRFTRGVVVAVIVFGLFLWYTVGVSTAFIDGAMATGPAGEASGPIVLMPGSNVEVGWAPERIEASITPSWLLWALPLLAFILVSHPWRLLFASRRTTVVASEATSS